jgi:hypothetical protein
MSEISLNSMLSLLHKTGHFHMGLYPFSGNKSLSVRLKVGTIDAGMWGVFPMPAHGDVYLMAGVAWERGTKNN